MERWRCREGEMKSFFGSQGEPSTHRKEICEKTTCVQTALGLRWGSAKGIELIVCW